MIPGKEALSSLNQHFQEQYGVTVTPTAIVDAMWTNEVSREMGELVETLTKFATLGR